MKAIVDFFKKTGSFIPVFASFPAWFQGIIITWIVVTLIILLIGVKIYSDEKRYVMKIMPNNQTQMVPYLHDDKNKEIILGLNVWAKDNMVFEICLINVEILSSKEQKYINYALKVTDNENKDLNFPVILKDNQKENILFHLPILNNDPITKARINFVPYDIRNKLSAEVTVSRGVDYWQIAIVFGRSHIEFGRFPMKGPGSKDIKFLEKFKGGPPEISTDFKPDIKQ